MSTSLDTIVAVARSRPATAGEKLAFANLKDGKDEQRPMSFAGLDRACRCVGAALQKRIAPQDRVLLLFPQGAEFVIGFFGALYGGAIAVPAHTPKPNKRSWATFEAIVADCQPSAILTCRAMRDNIAAWSKPYPSIAALSLLCIEDLESECAAEDWTDAGIGPESIAFLQYTSGSTNSPKGVMVSHANLLHNAALTARHMGHDESTIIVSWLPLFHDLGLIGIVVQTLFIGGTCYLMSPAAFSGNPALWLQAISRYRATTSMSSDFGYRLCVKSIRAEQMEGVDLSSWRNALNAAEPIHASTLREFQEKFGPFGFSPTAFFPAYGLAEATLLSTTSRVGEEPVILGVDKAALARGEFRPQSADGSEAIELVSSGRPSSDMDVAIVDPETGARCREGAIGEIWVRGGSIARGYWNAPEATARTFRQSPAGPAAPFFLRTGDLGFVWSCELFVAGRLKDLIILRGRNIYPQDIELTVKDCHPAFRTVNGTALSVDGGDGEAVVVIHEIERTARNGIDLQALAETVRNAVWQDHDVVPADIVFIPPASLPKTTSGKVQRRLTRELYLSGALPSLSRPAPASPAGRAESSGGSLRAIEEQILDGVGSLARGAPRAADATFGALGVDSVAAATLARHLGAAFGTPVEPTIFWQFQTPRLLAAHLAFLLGTSEPKGDDTPASGQPPVGLLHALRTALGKPSPSLQERLP